MLQSRYKQCKVECQPGVIMYDILLHHCLSFLPLKYWFGEGGRGGLKVKIPRLDRVPFSWLHWILWRCIFFFAIFNRVTRMGLHIFEILGVRKLRYQFIKRKIHGKKSCYRILIFNKWLPFHSGRTKMGVYNWPQYSRGSKKPATHTRVL